MDDSKSAGAVRQLGRSLMRLVEEIAALICVVLGFWTALVDDKWARGAWFLVVYLIVFQPDPVIRITRGGTK